MNLTNGIKGVVAGLALIGGTVGAAQVAPQAHASNNPVFNPGQLPTFTVPSPSISASGRYSTVEVVGSYFTANTNVYMTFYAPGPNGVNEHRWVPVSKSGRFDIYWNAPHGCFTSPVTIYAPDLPKGETAIATVVPGCIA